MNDTNAVETIFSFGVWVRTRRRTLRMTQQEVANGTGCSVVLIRKIEADTRRPSLQIAERLAHSLHIPLATIPAFLLAARAKRAPDRLPLPGQDMREPMIHPTALQATMCPSNAPQTTTLLCHTCPLLHVRFPCANT